MNRRDFLKGLLGGAVGSFLAGVGILKADDAPSRGVELLDAIVPDEPLEVEVQADLQDATMSGWCESVPLDTTLRALEHLPPLRPLWYDDGGWSLHNCNIEDLPGVMTTVVCDDDGQVVTTDTGWMQDYIDGWDTDTLTDDQKREAFERYAHQRTVWSEDAVSVHWGYTIFQFDGKQWMIEPDGEITELPDAKPV